MGKLAFMRVYSLHIWIASGSCFWSSSRLGSSPTPMQAPTPLPPQRGDRRTCSRRHLRRQKVVGAAGGSGGYFAHQRRDLRGQRGSWKRRKKARWRGGACAPVRAHDRGKDAGVPSVAHTPKAETRAGGGDTARGGEGLFLAEWGRLLVLLAISILPVLLLLLLLLLDIGGGGSSGGGCRFCACTRPCWL